jgi:hypothetical protein
MNSDDKDNHGWKIIETRQKADRLQRNIISGVLKYSNCKQKRSASMFFTPTNDDKLTTIIKHLKNKPSSVLDGLSIFLIKNC